MEPFLIHILGCGSALPTLRHSASSQVIELRGKLFMIDCGEGTQLQMRKYHISFTKIQTVFISHLHGDHCFGLIGLISTMGMLGRTAPLHIYAPAAMGPLLDLQLKMFCTGLEFNVVFHPVDTTKHQVIYDDRSLTVESLPLQHRVPCNGFLFREKATLPHIRRDMIDCYEIPVSQINNIKLGADWTTEDGDVIPNERLVSPADKPRSYAYCCDTRFIPALHQLIEGVDVLYHDSTYDKSMEERAALYNHSTSTQAAQVAKDAHVGQLLLGHFSARYDNEEGILNEAREIFPNTQLTDEGMTFPILSQQKTTKNKNINMAKMGKWIGGFLGLITAGPLGALAGFVLGAIFDSSVDAVNANGGEAYAQQHIYEGERNTFRFSLLVLASYIIRADGKVMHSEMNVVRSWLRVNFGEEAVEEGEDILLKLFEQQKRLGAAEYRSAVISSCHQLRQNMLYEQRLQLLNFLAMIAQADGVVTPQEVSALKECAVGLGLSEADVDAMLNLKDAGTSLDAAYKVLGVAPTATDDEVKAAYRQLALKNHPDRVATLGEDVRKAAEKKFQEINAAKETIWKARGL